jgi:Fe-Mn family superoxide dismutase
MRLAALCWQLPRCARATFVGDNIVTQAKEYELPVLPYGYGSLEPAYSKELLELHHDKHHASYVKGANKALSDLMQARKASDYAVINQIQKDLAFNLSGHVLHSIFWCNMSPDGGGDPHGALAQAIDESFGGTDMLREHLDQSATALQGSGWSALCYEPVSQRLIVEQIYDHQNNLGNGCVPLLVLDMWEHAYYLQYRNDKKQWIKSFWEVVDWSDVERRLAKVAPLRLGLVA